jgi:hypothetical protein
MTGDDSIASQDRQRVDGCLGDGPADGECVDGRGGWEESVEEIGNFL